MTSFCPKGEFSASEWVRGRLTVLFLKLLEYSVCVLPKNSNVSDLISVTWLSWQIRTYDKHLGRAPWVWTAKPAVEIFRTVGTTKVVMYRWSLLSCQTKFWNIFATCCGHKKAQFDFFCYELHRTPTHTTTVSCLTLINQLVLFSKRRTAGGNLTLAVRTNLLTMDFSVRFQWTHVFPFALWIPSFVSWPWTVSWVFCRW